MDCRTTSANTRARAGFTLGEVLVAGAVGAMLLGVICTTWSLCTRSSQAALNYLQMNNSTRQTLDRMVQEMREARSVKAFDVHQLTLSDAEGVDLVYTYDPEAQTLTRQQGADTDVLLSHCDTFEFAVFQRNPIPGSDDLYPAATASQAKVVQVRWHRSAIVMGSQVTEESIQSTRVVLRHP
jgi:Tfp pilus assembly protein PilW